MLPVILIVHYDAYITKFSVPYFSCCLMYHNCVCFQCVVCGEQDSNLHELSRVMYNCRFHFWVILVHHLKSGLIPDDFHYCPYHLLHYRRHACQLHHLPKALMWGTYQINF
jgi:hypothetical protein